MADPGSGLLQALRDRADPARAKAMAAYHKTRLPCLGVANPLIDELCRAMRRTELKDRLDAAAFLWASGVFEARIAAAKLLAGRNLARDDAVWALLTAWVPACDGWAIADHVAKAGSLCLVQDPQRLAGLEPWITDPVLWVRRAVLVFTLPWARLKAPSAADLARREKVLAWAASVTTDRDWFMQKAVGWWLRELSARDPARVRRFLADHGAAMKNFARKEALRHIGGT